jgi:tetratricopeptide (TPR) repeat protein
VLILLSAAALTGVIVTGLRSAQVSYWRAQRALPDDPQAALQLLEQAVERAGNNYPAAQLLWTRTLLQAGRWQEALGCFSLIPDPSRLEAESLLALADEAAERNSPLLATLALEAIPPASPARNEVLARLIRLRQRQAKWPVVESLARELLQHEPDHLEAWQALALSLEARISPPEAADAWREFLKQARDPERRKPALRSLLHLCMELGEREEARRLLDEFKTASGSSPLPPDVRLREAGLLRMEGQLEAASQAVETLLNEQPDDPAALELRGTLAMDRRDYERARQDFERLCERQPWNKQGHYRLAQCLQQLGQTEDAGRHFAENKRLTEISIRILDLQSTVQTGSAEIERLEQLAQAFEEIGQTVTAERHRQQARQLRLTSP